MCRAQQGHLWSCLGEDRRSSCDPVLLEGGHRSFFVAESPRVLRLCVFVLYALLCSRAFILRMICFTPVAFGSCRGLAWNAACVRHLARYISCSVTACSSRHAGSHASHSRRVSPDTPSGHVRSPATDAVRSAITLSPVFSFHSRQLSSSRWRRPWGTCGASARPSPPFSCHFSGSTRTALFRLCTSFRLS